jgi:hypothetical protein
MVETQSGMGKIFAFVNGPEDTGGERGDDWTGHWKRTDGPEEKDGEIKGDE